MELKERERQILSILMRMNTYITGDDLSNELGVSLKTIQRDIANINRYFQKLEKRKLITSSRGNGYFINSKNRAYIDKMFTPEEAGKNIPVDPSNRIEWIITEFCFAALNNEAITLNRLADALYISMSTLKKDMQGVKNVLNSYQLDLVKDGNKGLKLEGSEKDVRGLLAEYLFKKNRFNSRQIPAFDDGRDLSSLLQKILKEYGIQMTDIGLNNFIFHIQVALLRIQSGKNISNESEYPVNTESKEYMCAKRICENLQERFQLIIPEEEVLNIFLHLSAQKMMVKEENILYTIQSLENTQESEVVSEVLHVIDDIYGFHFQRDEILRVGLLIHLKSALLRIKLGYPIRNEFLEDIQKNYPFAMQLAFFLANKINESLDIQIDLDETGYLALHFCGALERMGKKERILRTSLVCASGGGTAILLKSKLENSYRNRISVEGVYSMQQMDEINFENTDVIISTVRLKDDYPVPVLYVTPIVHDLDMQKINDFINEKNNRLMVQDMMSKNLFYVNKNFQTKEEIIRFMSQRLVDLGYIDKTCQESIWEREKLASTEIGNMVAAPHNMGDGLVYHPSVSFMLLDNPVRWYHGDVKLVMMIVSNVNDNKYYKDVFLELYNQVDFQYKVDEILNRKDFDYLYNLFN